MIDREFAVRLVEAQLERESPGQLWLRSSQRVSFVDEPGCQLRAEQPSSVDEFECHSGGRGGSESASARHRFG